MKESFISWNEYSSLFKEKAEKHNIDKGKVKYLLDYGRELSDKNLPIIYDLEHLSYLTGYRLSYIKRAINRPNNFYRNFKIPKKNGHTRNIFEPLPGLKEIQYWILRNILYEQPINQYNYAYTPGKSIKTNAKFHTKQAIVLNIDIEDYFQSITEKQVVSFFNTLGYNRETCIGLSKLCTLNDGLPQGAPVSPILSNLLTVDLDKSLLSYCRGIGCRYSRYADDITISGTFDVNLVIKEIRNTLSTYGFRINNKKIRAKKPHQRQMVTGLVVNKKIAIKKTDLRQLDRKFTLLKLEG